MFIKRRVKLSASTWVLERVVYLRISRIICSLLICVHLTEFGVWGGETTFSESKLVLRALGKSLIKFRFGRKYFFSNRSRVIRSPSVVSRKRSRVLVLAWVKNIICDLLFLNFRPEAETLYLYTFEIWNSWKI